MVPPPNCTNPNPSTQTDGVDCFCPDGMLIREDGTCALPANCIGQFIANCELYCCRLLDNTTHLHIWFMCYIAVFVRSNTYYIWCVHMSNIACVCIWHSAEVWVFSTVLELVEQMQVIFLGELKVAAHQSVPLRFEKVMH